MSKVTKVRFTVRGYSLDDIEAAATKQVWQAAAGRPYQFKIGIVEPYMRSGVDGEVVDWEAEVWMEVSADDVR